LGAANDCPADSLYDNAQEDTCIARINHRQ
jgi:hypothetical protein